MGTHVALLTAPPAFRTYRAQVIKIRFPETAKFKQHWAIRRLGQIRSKASRGKRFGPPTRSRGSGANKFLPWPVDPKQKVKIH
eukprot:scaffold78320_cov40-Tisochrysis_lutea.AAC.2